MKISEKKSYSIDMTCGPIAKKLIVFSVPLALTVFLQFLYNSADLAVVGKFAEHPDTSLAAVGVTAPVTGLLVNLFLGLSLGANIVVAQLIGAGDENAVSRAVHTSVIMSLIFGIAGGLAGVLLSEKILSLINCEGKLFRLADQYIKIIFAGLPFTLVYNFGTAILRACGDTKKPFIILTVSGLINVALNLLFVIVFKTDVAGVALATIISQAFSAVAVIVVLAMRNDACKFSFKNFKIDFRQFKQILFIGIPSGLQSTTFSITNILVNAYIVELGETMEAGFTLHTTVSNYISSVTSALSQATIAFVAQNYGARNYKFIGKIEKTAMFLCLGITAAVSASFILLRYPVFRIFTSSDATISVANTGFLICVPFYFVWGFSEISIGAAKGLNSKTVPMIISVLGVCGFRLIYLLFVFPINRSYTLLMAVYPASWFLTGVMQFIWYKLLYKKTLKYAAAQIDI